MKLISTRDSSHHVDYRNAVLNGLAPDGGLYVPTSIPKLPTEFIAQLEKYSLQEISLEIAKSFLGYEIPENELQEIVHKAINFPAPLVSLNESIFSLELFHGPSMAFKDFGARFMAQLMSYFNREESEPLHILVATSGDTGGAVALGFLGVPGIEVSILYPSGRVSELQELQLTTNGQNIHAFEVAGSFDDCQAMVKGAFSDPELSSQLRLTSANSINISRLIPQSFYYLHTLAELYRLNPSFKEKDIAFSIPSGNFGNLTAGVFAKMMGGNITSFLAATNVNDVVPRYLSSGTYEPRESIRTISNAMDVGNPSNYERLEFYFKNNHSTFKEHMTGYRYTDEETAVGISECWEKYNYQADPHGAIGYLAAKDWLSEDRENRIAVFLETAHPIKFKDDVEKILSLEVTAPPQSQELLNREKQAIKIESKLTALKEHLLK